MDDMLQCFQVEDVEDVEDVEAETSDLVFCSKKKKKE